jgi:hypothetical protein
MELPALTIASAAAWRPGMRCGRMTANGRRCRLPGPAREACLLQLPDVGRDEPEAVLLGGFVVELDRVARRSGNGSYPSRSRHRAAQAEGQVWRRRYLLGRDKELLRPA